jgi:dihydroorotate dehydrogenase
VAAIAATNTTLSRDGVEGHPRAGEAGGLSGAPLTARAQDVVRRVALRAAGRVPVIGSGGIMSAEDAWARIRAGATLVQVYTGFIYGGPGFPSQLNAGLLRLMERDGFRTIEAAIGADLKG